MVSEQGGKPRLRSGRFISSACPECGNGTLRQEGDGWRCDGLIDPENPAAELEACRMAVVGGVAYSHKGMALADVANG